MKKSLLCSTALIGATALTAGTAGAAEAPTWKLTGNANFQLYWVDQDNTNTKTKWNGSDLGNTYVQAYNQHFWNNGPDSQDHDWYFGVDEAELQINVSGAADNGLNYGFKIEINANTTDGPKGIADEARLQLSGSWGTLQMGDEDGAEDIMNYGGENLMGATGGFDGDQDDYLVRAGDVRFFEVRNTSVGGTKIWMQLTDTIGGDGTAAYNWAAPSYPTIAGDTADKTKVSYFSPRISGFQVGASITPTPNEGDGFKADGSWENAYGIGANYDNSFGGLRIRASAVFAAASSNDTRFEDVSAFQVGGIVGWGPFSLGANYGDNGDSGELKWSGQNGNADATHEESYFWDVAASFETGPMYFAAGYFVGVKEIDYFGDSTYEHIALTADYTVAPGLGVYAEINLISDELVDALGPAITDADETNSHDTTSMVIGANISF